MHPRPERLHLAVVVAIVDRSHRWHLNHYTWRRVIGWIRRKHPRVNWKTLRRRYFHHGWQLGQDGVDLFDTRAVAVTRYRYRGAKIPTPWDGWNTITAT